jgi:hypothetical protein
MMIVFLNGAPSEKFLSKFLYKNDSRVMSNIDDSRLMFDFICHFFRLFIGIICSVGQDRDP